MPTCSAQRNHPSSAKMLRRLVMAALLLVWLCGPPTRSASLSPLPSKRSSSAIAVTSDGAILLVVNPDSNSVTPVDMPVDPPLPN